MAQVSRLPLPKALEEQMHTLFRRALADLRTEQDIADFLDDLLSPTEKVMLGKRLAIAVLLEQGYDQRTVHRILKVSLATVNSVNYWLKNKGKGYRKVIGRIKKEQEWADFAQKLDGVLRKFLQPPRTMGDAVYLSRREEKVKDSLL